MFVYHLRKNIIQILSHRYKFRISSSGRQKFPRNAAMIIDFNAGKLAVLVYTLLRKNIIQILSTV